MSEDPRVEEIALLLSKHRFGAACGPYGIDRDLARSILSRLAGGTGSGEAFRPITWQDVRLAAGEGKLKPETVLAACNVELRRRQHVSPSPPPPAAGWTEETLKPIRDRERSLTEWLRDNSPFCVTDQKHLDENSVERAYWHYGYMVALRDVLKRLALSTLAPPPSGRE